LAREHLPDGLVLAVPDGAAVPPPLDKPKRPEPVNGWLCRGVICLEPISDLIQLKTACKEKS
jgi:predicted component of type VI protein secretion system